MATSPSETNQNMSSDAMHNRNCYAFFLQLKPLINDTIISLIPDFQLFFEEYNANFAYGNLYTQSMSQLEQLIEKNEALNECQSKALDDLIYGIYHNDNKILDVANSGWIYDIASKSRPQRLHNSKLISKHLHSNEKAVNANHPTAADQLVPRAIGLVEFNYKPQLGTNLPSIKNTKDKTDKDPTEYRFCTQAQFHHGQARVSPLFKRFLQIQATRFPAKITHIYFNNLGYDRTLLDIPGWRERKLSLALHDLEQDPTLKNVLIITLPAYQGLMDPSDYKKTHDILDYQTVYNEFLAITNGKGEQQSSISDFVMSPDTRSTLFGSEKEATTIFKELLDKSFLIQGIKAGTHLSTAQRQAVWLHFIKYELTNYIINTVNPVSYNFSCKDAIDRGAVSSTYYNLMKSFDLNAPISRQEFECSLDAAAASVKGRGMNFHRQVIWNALDAYVNANYKELITNKEKAWLIYWRDMNCPYERVEGLLQKRIKQAIEFADLLTNKKVKTNSRLLFTAAETLNGCNVSGKRLLLEAVSRTCELANSPTYELMSDYQILATELIVNYPQLKMIGGIMEMLLGVLLYLPSFGYSRSLIEQGRSTYNAGFFAQHRQELVEQMDKVQDATSILISS